MLKTIWPRQILLAEIRKRITLKVLRERKGETKYRSQVIQKLHSKSIKLYEVKSRHGGEKKGFSFKQTSMLKKVVSSFKKMRSK